MQTVPRTGGPGKGSVLGREGLLRLTALQDVLGKQPLKRVQFSPADSILELDGLRNRLHAVLLKQEGAAKGFLLQSHRDRDLHHGIMFDDVLNPAMS